MANFKKDSPRGHSPFGVECIARFDGVERNKDGEIKGYCVSFQTNEAVRSWKEIYDGKGQENPYLINRGKHNDYSNTSIMLSKGQFDALNEAIGDNRFVSSGYDAGRSGHTYGAFKADVNISVKAPARDENGKVIKGDDGKPVLKCIGMMPNSKTFAPSDCYSDEMPFDGAEFNSHVKKVAYTNKLRDEERAAAKEARKTAPKKFSVSLDTSLDNNEAQADVNPSFN